MDFFMAVKKSSSKKPKIKRSRSHSLNSRKYLAKSLAIQVASFSESHLIEPSGIQGHTITHRASSKKNVKKSKQKLVY